ncbi:MAG: NERD domain-containing protein [Gammaproteobacteria bacterium]|nr:NERD domain-containing protein [Gammaproteobacteria bacterium]
MDELVRFIDTLQFDPLFFGSIAAVLLLAGVLLLWQPLLRVRAYMRLQKSIRGSGLDWLRDVYVPGGVDGQIYLEYVILMPQGLLLINVKPYYGNIFAGEQIEYWTQVIGLQSFKFKNPLHQLHITLGELRSVTPKIAIDSRVLFTPGSRFPKGKPEQVLQLEELNSFSNTQQTPPSETIIAAWEMLRAQAQPANQIRLGVYLRQGDRRRMVYGSGLVIITVIWMVWLGVAIA